MVIPEPLNLNEEKFDIIQWNADTSRLLKISLRNHDSDSLEAVRKRIALIFGDDFANRAICTMITFLMTTENWSFVDDQGNPSPLI